MNETSCFNNSILVLNANNTFTATGSSLEIVFDGTTSTLECTDDPDFSGTWSLAGNVLSVTYTDEGDTFTDQYIVSGNTLKASIQQGEVVGTANGGEPVYLTANIDIIYTKQ
jgi:hypothetical protein